MAELRNYENHQGTRAGIIVNYSVAYRILIIVTVTTDARARSNKQPLSFLSSFGLDMGYDDTTQQAARDTAKKTAKVIVAPEFIAICQ